MITAIGSLVWSSAGGGSGGGGAGRNERGSKLARKRSRGVSLARVKSEDSGAALNEDQV